MLRALLSRQPIDTDFALLVLRIGIGFSMLVFHGWGKLIGGPAAWERIGGNMTHLGIGFWPVVWGCLAALSESVGSALLIVGVLTRPAAGVLAFTMVIAVLRHLSIPEGEPGAGWKGASHALELLVVYVALLLAGPGRYALSGRGR